MVTEFKAEKGIERWVEKRILPGLWRLAILSEHGKNGYPLAEETTSGLTISTKLTGRNKTADLQIDMQEGVPPTERVSDLIKNTYIFEFPSGGGKRVFRVIFDRGKRSVLATYTPKQR